MYLRYKNVNIEGLCGITPEWLFAHNCVTAVVPQNPGTHTEQKIQ